MVRIGWQALIGQIVVDVLGGIAPRGIAAGFHRAVAAKRSSGAS